MSRRPHNTAFTSEFGHEVELERQAWLGRRLQWYCGVMIVLGLLSYLVTLSSSTNPVNQGLSQVLFWATGVLSTAAYALAIVYVRRRGPKRFSPLQLATWLIIGVTGLTLLASPVWTRAINEAAMVPGARNASGSVQIGLGGPPPPAPAPAEAPAAAAPASPEPVATKDEPEDEPAAETPAAKTAETAAEPAAKTKAKSKSKSRPQRRSADDEFLAVLTGKFAPLLTGGFMGLWSIFISHFLACCFLPWSVRECLRPVWPLLILNLGLMGWYGYESMERGLPPSIAITAVLIIMLASLFTPLAGMAVCWWRHSRFRNRMTFDLVRGRYAELKQELTSARQIHEGLFPLDIKTGPVRFAYAYEPMRQIGGDYLHTFCAAGGKHATGPGDGLGLAEFQPAQGDSGELYSFVLMDVTGHGIPAALTVNRLHGELTRIFAENPRVAPGELLSLLNRYVHLTLASHSVYVTAMCFRVDPVRNELEYASGGHPPAFLRDAAGRIEQLDSTTFVLGACHGEDFRSEPRTLKFAPGDVVVAYTDGATEARDQQGRYFGVAGIQRLVAKGAPDPTGGWPTAIRRAVEKHRHGPTADDILVIEIRRPV